MTGEGATFLGQKITRVSCAECEALVTVSSLIHHMKRSHGIKLLQMIGVEVREVGTTTYVVSFHFVLKNMDCAVPVCTAVDHNARRL